VEIVSATRVKEAAFGQTPLGQSLSRLQIPASIAFENAKGLPEIYNARIAASPEDVLVFVHDDVWILDHFFVSRVLEGLGQYDVIGVAGARRRSAGQITWGHTASGKWDPDNHSGCVAHGNTPITAKMDLYGDLPAECDLLDGVLLAARSSTLRNRNVAFDPRFTFHFYDVDFCRTAREAGLRLGTWPLSITHAGHGVFGTPEWQTQCTRYLQKWGD